MNSPIQALQWRYATKQFDTSKKLSAEQLHVVTEALRLAPSSFGLQPWKFIVVTNPEVRAQLREAAWGQPQVTDASHLIVLAAKTNMSVQTVDEYVRVVAETRGVDVAQLTDYANMMKGAIEGKTAKELIEWNARQVYLALGTLITAAAVEEIDVAPMEGFDPQQFDDILGLAEKNVTSVVLAAVGFRSEEDSTAAAPKVRFAPEAVIMEIQ